MKKINFYTVTVSILLLTSLLTVIFATNKLLSSENVLFEIKSDKNSIFLGEVVNLAFEFTNEGKTAVHIPGGGVMSGNIEIFIAKDGQNYRKYFRSDWGRKNERIITLAPNETHKIDGSNATLLWNGRPDYSHLNPDAAEKADKQDNRILTDYVFPEAGTYLVKATSCLIDKTMACSTPVESKPVEIQVKEPVGEDLQVWNQIKGNRGIAMLLQKGNFGTGKDTEKEQLTTDVEDILEKYPDSIYSKYLKPKLENFRVREAKRDEFYRNITPSRKP